MLNRVERNAHRFRWTVSARGQRCRNCYNARRSWCCQRRGIPPVVRSNGADGRTTTCRELHASRSIPSDRRARYRRYAIGYNDSDADWICCGHSDDRRWSRSGNHLDVVGGSGAISDGRRHGSRCATHRIADRNVLHSVGMRRGSQSHLRGPNRKLCRTCSLQSPKRTQVQTLSLAPPSAHPSPGSARARPSPHRA